MDFDNATLYSSRNVWPADISAAMVFQVKNGRDNGMGGIVLILPPLYYPELVM